MRRQTLQASFLAAAIAGPIGFAACTIVDPAPGAIVTFQLDAPLCSTRIPVEFSIDSMVVGTDTFVVHLGSADHTRSREFVTSPGTHTLRARTGIYTWPDKTLSLSDGQSVTDTLPFYCS